MELLTEVGGIQAGQHHRRTASLQGLSTPPQSKRPGKEADIQRESGLALHQTEDARLELHSQPQRVLT